MYIKREGEVVRADKDNAHLQDSTMLEADLGAPAVGDVIKRKELEAKGDKNGTQISMSYDEIKQSKERGDEAKTRRSADGTWTMKRGKSYSGFKLHTKVRAKDSIIEDYEVTTASVHDSKVDLSKPKEPVMHDAPFWACVRVVLRVVDKALLAEFLFWHACLLLRPSLLCFMHARLYTEL